jgi:hypothetical protein
VLCELTKSSAWTSVAPTTVAMTKSKPISADASAAPATPPRPRSGASQRRRAMAPRSEAEPQGVSSRVE